MSQDRRLRRLGRSQDDPAARARYAREWRLIRYLVAPVFPSPSESDMPSRPNPGRRNLADERRRRAEREGDLRQLFVEAMRGNGPPFSENVRFIGMLGQPDAAFAAGIDFPVTGFELLNGSQVAGMEAADQGPVGVMLMCWAILDLFASSHIYYMQDLAGDWLRMKPRSRFDMPGRVEIVDELFAVPFFYLLERASLFPQDFRSGEVENQLTVLFSRASQLSAHSGGRVLQAMIDALLPWVLAGSPSRWDPESQSKPVP